MKVSGLSQSEVRDLIVGKEGTPVTLGIKRRPHDYFSIRVLRSNGSSATGASPLRNQDSSVYTRSSQSQESLSGNSRLCGIAMNIARNSQMDLYIVSMMPNGPAALSGLLQPGDIILKAFLKTGSFFF